MQMVGYQGIPGSFSYQAACIYFDKNIELIPKDSFDDVFELLDKGELDMGILPVENSSVGMISRVFDLLSRYNLNIQGELYLKVQHNLLALPGTELDEIEEVYSHPKALEQCSVFLKGFPKWKVVPFYDTARSAKWVRDNRSCRYAAVASLQAAKLYGLDVVASDIHDNSLNYTRFIVVGKELATDSMSDKISLNISLKHRPGSLYKVVEQFAKHNLNMLSIKSRPIVTKPFEYMFYIDFEGNLDDINVKRAIGGIKHHCANFKLMGNYKSGEFNHVL